MKKNYQKIIPELMKKLKLTNKLAVPTLKKIIINCSFREDQHQDKAIEDALKWLSQITGQKAVVTHAKRSEAGFSIRANDPLGVMVTLRGNQMWHFFQKLVHLVIPNFKDFQGLKRAAFDGQGNYSFGIPEQILFPELRYDDVEKIRPLQVTIITSASDDKIAHLLLKQLNFPFAKKSKNNG
jgi:large subunit ribosomal protein L5